MPCINADEEKTLNQMEMKLLATMLLAGACMFGADLSIGIRIGAPPPPRVVAVRPASPGPGFLWVDGYWYPDGGHYKWHAGYWTRPPYAGAHWIAPHHDGQQFFNGYWDGDRGRFDHDHKWDRDHNRDYRDRH
jgi:WXXGXW repeat (2 copies)